MPEVILSDYFYGAESEEFIYFKIPLLLITDQKFKHVSTDAKLLYGMLLDRMGLSAKNNWYDDYGRVYIYYTVDEICEDMCCGRDKAMKLLAVLDKKKGIGLVERVKQGMDTPPSSMSSGSPPGQRPRNPWLPLQIISRPAQTSKKTTPRRRKNRPQDVGKNHLKRSKKPTLIILRGISLTLTTLIHPSLPPSPPVLSWGWIDTN